uniref:NADH-ubiquinone oxidoreductase chain 4 n=1 Tax=Carapus bermudensis TaxID=181393 RepID=Q8HMI6_9TELE|nr:NADH dehydrogenase subunit 4 [Carapus bermudensis]BAC23173.1 NADH dehydrogenase subunit 4 [Carapus bermudensis]
MLMVLIPTLMLVPVTWLSPPKWVWAATLMHSLLIAVISLKWLYTGHETGWHELTPSMGLDPLSTPLLVLTCWLLPLMILASQGHMQIEPANRQRTFITLLISLQTFLIVAFGATEMIMFYVMFEATLIPTLVLIARWGNQPARLNASTYFLLYTLTGSLPLLVALLALYNEMGTLSLLVMQYPQAMVLVSHADMIWWTGCVIAFLVKMPLYGIHLWLPKAHVEAPIAGSMVLAAVLLKLGGYGMMRMMTLLEPLTLDMCFPFIALALWGMAMTSSICMRQNDLKSLIAYSSVSHMGAVAAGILVQTSWGFTGALALMIAHGLTSSALFCLANTNYERIHSRTIVLARGLQLVLPLMATWWLLATLANLALPPLPNYIGELVLVTALFKWSNWTLPLTGLAILITAAYSLYMFLLTQRGPTTKHAADLVPTYCREHLLLALHILPLLLIILKPSLISGWFA